VNSARGARLTTGRTERQLRRLGARIRRLRERAGLTQADLAGDALSVSVISRVESGQANPPLMSIALIAAVLDVPLRDLFPADW
jgi:transcriptional regulator with XRE-family HTH domain